MLAKSDALAAARNQAGSQSQGQQAEHGRLGNQKAADLAAGKLITVKQRKKAM